jgi:hypothetical protein
MKGLGTFFFQRDSKLERKVDTTLFTKKIGNDILIVKFMLMISSLVQQMKIFVNNLEK